MDALYPIDADDLGNPEHCLRRYPAMSDPIHALSVARDGDWWSVPGVDRNDDAEAA